jgi:hypothetical protein
MRDCESVVNGADSLQPTSVRVVVSGEGIERPHLGCLLSAMMISIRAVRCPA